MNTRPLDDFSSGKGLQRICTKSYWQLVWMDKVKKIITGTQEEELEGATVCAAFWTCFPSLLWSHQGECTAWKYISLIDAGHCESMRLLICQNPVSCFVVLCFIQAHYDYYITHHYCKLHKSESVLLFYFTWQDDANPVGGFSLRGCLVSSLEDNGVPSGESVSPTPMSTETLWRSWTTNELILKHLLLLSKCC